MCSKAVDTPCGSHLISQLRPINRSSADFFFFLQRESHRGDFSRNAVIYGQ